MIEKNIFQLYKTKTPPLLFRRYVNSFKKQKGYQHTIFTDTEMNAFIKRYYPELEEAYRELPVVQKTDLLRLLLIYHYGGIYSDLDTICHVHLDVLYNEFPEAAIIVGWEANVDDETKSTYKLVRNRQICNWTFAAAKGNPILKAVIDQVTRNIKNAPGLDTLNKTGPGVFTDVILQYEGRSDLVILPVHYFCAGVPYEIRELTEKSYIEHKFWGSWKKDVLYSDLLLFYVDGYLGTKATNLVKRLLRIKAKLFKK